MKTTVELPDELFIAAKRRAAEDRTTLRAMVERGLREQLRGPRSRTKRAPKSTQPIRWVTVDGGLPPGLNLADRAAVLDWLRAHR